MDSPEPQIDDNPTYVLVPLDFLEAVAHIGVNFGHGEYELEQKWIELARNAYESNKCK